MRKGSHLVRAFHAAMDEGRIEDASAILGECMFPDHVVGWVLTRWYDGTMGQTFHRHVSGAILERVTGF